MRLLDFLLKYKDHCSGDKQKIVNTRQNAITIRPVPKFLYTKSYRTAYYKILKILNRNKTIHFDDLHETCIHSLRNEILNFETDEIKTGVRHVVYNCMKLPQ